MESLDQCRRLEVSEKARNVFCEEPTSVWPQVVTQQRIFIKRAEEQNREEGEMAQQKLGGGRNRGKSKEEGEKEKLGVGRIELDGPELANSTS